MDTSPSKLSLVFLVPTAFLISCALPYRPLYGDIGYTVEALENDNYRVEYRGGARASFVEIRNLLARYVADLCPAGAPLSDVVEDTFVPTVWDGSYKPGPTKEVFALIQCKEIDPAVMERSYRSRF